MITQDTMVTREETRCRQAVLLRGFEGLDEYHEVPADVVLAVEKEKGPTKKAAAAGNP